eukprot:scaffold40799_cov31-Cyclotella_meneghiniana.AAC.7
MHCRFASQQSKILLCSKKKEKSSKIRGQTEEEYSVQPQTNRRTTASQNHINVMSKRKAESLDAGKPMIPATIIDGHQWTSIISYLEHDDLKSLRLAGSKQAGLLFGSPLLTSHLPLRLDRVNFFTPQPDPKRHRRYVAQWLFNRKRIIIADRTQSIQSSPVASLVKHGYMKAVTELDISHCSFYRSIITHLVKLPNLKDLKLSDTHNLRAHVRYGGKNYDAVIRETTAIVECLQNMKQLESLDIEFDGLVDGKCLSVLREMKNLRSLRLRGFDFSSGIEHVHSLDDLEHLHLCHGNTRCTPDNAVPPEAFLSLEFLSKLKTIHLENIDNLSNEQICPLTHFKSTNSLTFKHCQAMNGNALESIGNMTSLQELHFVNCASDDTRIFETEQLAHLQNLKHVKTLSLLFVMIDPYDILDLSGMDSLETLNIGLLTTITKKEFDIMCLRFMPLLPKLKRLRIYGADEESLNQLVYSILEDDTKYYDVDVLCVGEYEIEFRLFEERHDHVDID